MKFLRVILGQKLITSTNGALIQEGLVLFNVEVLIVEKEQVCLK